MNYMGIFMISIILEISRVSSLPDIFCDPFFATITQLVNNSYFIVDEYGNYWIVSDNERVTRNNKNGNIANFVNERGIEFNSNNFTTFDLTFITNFDEQCLSLDERLYGLKFNSGSNTSYTSYRLNKWRIISIMKSGNMGTKFFDIASTLGPNKRIGAVLNIKPNSMIIIQESNVIHVYCDQQLGWKLDIKHDYIEFRDKSGYSFSDIYGGFVDADHSNTYLFPAEKSSSNNYIRKVYHKCDYHFENTTRAKRKLVLICVKHAFNSFCISRSFWEKYLILIIILAVIFCVIIACFAVSLTYYLFSRKRKLKQTNDRLIHTLLNDRK